MIQMKLKLACVRSLLNRYVLDGCGGAGESFFVCGCVIANVTNLCVDGLRLYVLIFLVTATERRRLDECLEEATVSLHC